MSDNKKTNGDIVIPGHVLAGTSGIVFHGILGPASFLLPVLGCLVSASIYAEQPEAFFQPYLPGVSPQDGASPFLFQALLLSGLPTAGYFGYSTVKGLSRSVAELLGNKKELTEKQLKKSDDFRLAGLVPTAAFSALILSHMPLYAGLMAFFALVTGQLGPFGLPAFDSPLVYLPAATIPYSLAIAANPLRRRLFGSKPKQDGRSGAPAVA